MKLTKTFFSLLLLGGLLITSFVGCEGPAGPPGDSAVANLEGFKEGIQCADCHDPDSDSTYFVWAKKYQWAESKHAFGGDFERNSASCAGCHTTEGYIQAQKGGTVTDHVDSSPPGCFACHSPHRNGDFSLRTVAPVLLTSPIQGVADASFDYGTGNLCVSCHKPRTITPKPDPNKTAVTDTITISNVRWYPHYGVQGQNLMGTGGFKFVDYNYTGNSNHTNNAVIKQNGCISCHMADATAGSGIAGGHTMNISYENTSHMPASLTTGCTTSGCHTAAGFTVNYIGASADLTGGLGSHEAVEAYLDTLGNMLADPLVVNKWNAGAKKAWIVLSEEGATINASSGANALKISPASRAGALFNYMFIEHDRSKGSHNTRYTLELLISSIRELRK